VQLKNDLEASRPERGPNPEYPLRVASAVMTILERAGFALDDHEKGPLVITISIAFEALGIAKGEPRRFAREVLASRE